MIVITIAFVSCFSWLRSGIERYADRKLSPCCQFFVSGFVGLLTYPFMRRGFSPLHKRIASAFSRSHDSPSNDRFSPRARFALHGKQYFRNTATFGILPSPLHSMIHRLQTEKRDSFRVRDSHPIPLFSWNKNACPFGAAGAVCTESASVRVAHLPQKPVIDSFFHFYVYFSLRNDKKDCRFSGSPHPSHTSCFIHGCFHVFDKYQPKSAAERASCRCNRNLLFACLPFRIDVCFCPREIFTSKR